MDIIISAQQGARKTATALAMIKTYYGLADVSAVVEKTYHVTRPGMAPVRFSPKQLAVALISAAQPCVLFDGCLHTPQDMTDAVAAVRMYRQAAPDRDILAVYVECHPKAVVILQDNYNQRQGYSDVVNEVLNECEVQDTRFGPDRVQSLLKWFAIYNEEVLEFAREVVGHAMETDPSKLDALLEDARTELVQATAVGIQVLKSFFARKDMLTPQTVATGNTPRRAVNPNAADYSEKYEGPQIDTEALREQCRHLVTKWAKKGRAADIKRIVELHGPSCRLSEVPDENLDVLYDGLKEYNEENSLGTIEAAMDPQYERLRRLVVQAQQNYRGADIRFLLDKYADGAKTIKTVDPRNYDKFEARLNEYVNNGFKLPGRVTDDGRKLYVAVESGNHIVFEKDSESDGIVYPNPMRNTVSFKRGDGYCGGFNPYLVLDAKPEHRTEYFNLLNSTPYEI